MHTRRITRASARCCLSGVCSLIAQPAVAQQTAPDNTKVNKADQAKGGVTADQQSESAADRDLAKRIRQSVVGDKSLSTYAHNVKIVAQGRASHPERTSPIGSGEDIDRSQGDRDCRRRQGQQ